MTVFGTYAVEALGEATLGFKGGCLGGELAVEQAGKRTASSTRAALAASSGKVDGRCYVDRHGPTPSTFVHDRALPAPRPPLRRQLRHGAVNQALPPGRVIARQIGRPRWRRKSS